MSEFAGKEAGGMTGNTRSHIQCFSAHYMDAVKGVPLHYEEVNAGANLGVNSSANDAVSSSYAHAHTHDLAEELRTKSTSSLQVVSCDICNGSGLELADKYYHCPECQFDLCLACSETSLVDLPKEKLISKLVELYESKNELIGIVKDLKGTVDSLIEVLQQGSIGDHQHNNHSSAVDKELPGKQVPQQLPQQHLKAGKRGEEREEDAESARKGAGAESTRDVPVINNNSEEEDDETILIEGEYCSGRYQEYRGATFRGLDILPPSTRVEVLGEDDDIVGDNDDDA